MTQLREIFTYFIVWSSVTVFCFALFRFRLSAYRKQLFFTSVILTQGAYFAPMLHLHDFKPLIFTILLFACIILFFKIHWLHALIMVLATYAFCILSLFVSRFALTGWSLEQLSFPKPLPIKVRLFAALYMYTVTWLLYRFRRGFTFIPSYPVKCTGPTPRWIKIILVLGAFSICIRVLSFFVWDHLVPLDLAVVSILFIVVLYLFYKKENS
ncbi:hypothetical protein [Paenibacillus rigui]|uniref:Uncharacterized protein n=1 Tax=Paenibacillus rigui TaxID=554312 RepID=A0A229ULV6_9BACL|nr:hypothetical protein [Paenibacillus rigui]OXM84396.1 hypothetical protein CF651_21725 [Paenibacillus rigui]